VAEYFHRTQRREAVTRVATRQPDVVCTIRVGGEVTARSREWQTGRPSVTTRIIDVDLGRRIGRNSAAADNPHFCT
jgi:hypothetical protein